mgnify:CR=1 FL=1
MNLIRFCVRRPVFTWVTVILAALLGLYGYFKLGVALYPKVDIPVIVITTSYRGASPAESAPGTVIGPAADGDWWVMVHGERWRARSRVPLAPGDRVRVDRLDGLTLDVSPAAESPTLRSASS